MSARNPQNDIATLIKKLDTQSDTKALAAIQKLRDCGNAALQPLLEAAQDEGLPRIRKWALRALGGFNDAQAKKVLFAALRDERMSIRLQAVRGIRDLGDSKNGKVLIPLLTDESGGVRWNVAATLASLNVTDAVKPIESALKSEQKKAVISALKSAVSVLKKS